VQIAQEEECRRAKEAEIELRKTKKSLEEKEKTERKSTGETK